MVNCLIENYDEILEANGFIRYYSSDKWIVRPLYRRQIFSAEIIEEIVAHCDKERAKRKLTGEKISW